MKPRQIAYIIWTVIALLGAVSWVVPDGGWHIGKWDLRFPTLAEALDLEKTVSDLSLDSTWLAEADTTISKNGKRETENDNAATVKGDTLAKKDTIAKKTQPVIPTVNVANTDTRAYLAAFYAALDSADSTPVRVVHYGDSQIEEDRITNILRERWQKAYGGGGVGLIPQHQTIPTRTIRQSLSINGVVQSAQGGPKRYLVYGPRSMRLDNDDYGVMGQVAVMDSTLVAGSEDIVMKIEPIDKKRKPHNYFNRVRVLTDSVTGYVLAQDSLFPIAHHQSPIVLADSTTKCEIHLQGKGKVYGVSLETGTGVIVDNIPMRGCSGNIFTKIDSTQLSDFYRETNTRLIILQFGGNMIPQTENASTISGYVRSTLRQQVRYLRACAPEASILFIGPSDMSTRIDGEMTSYPLVPYMDKLLKKMAEEEQIAYWSMYDAMGGKDSMVRWVEVGLAGSDYVHFTRTGANKVGKQLGEWIDKGKDL
ncbi:MAG: hypothetical protein IKY87_01160 [Paludibacteraceae bacterium]|nr:hypothetical protein [Paludibacteraceae bacterium]